MVEATMPRQNEAFDLQEALLDPAGSFAEPEDILGDERLTAEQKRRLLEQWERDAVNLSVAETEGMAGGEENRLTRVRRALDKLAVKPASSSGEGPTG
jgi:hypothetical protein